MILGESVSKTIETYSLVAHDLASVQAVVKSWKARWLSCEGVLRLQRTKLNDRSEN